MAHSILLIDDDSALRRVHRRFFERDGWEVFESASGEEGLQSYEANLPDLVLLDLQLPAMHGLNVLEVLISRGATVILLTGHGAIKDAVEAMRLGAENFLSKPVTLSHLGAVVDRAMEKVSLVRTNRLLAQNWVEGRQTPALGSSARMRDLGRQAELLAASESATVLLLGESGTGKGWLAEMIHAHSPRARGPFVEINCAGLSPTLLDSELFGHEKGAFTDASATKRGLFEVADGGTLLLDEIGDLAPELQPKLLKVLERKVFRRVGGTKEIRVNVRLIAATNKSLADEVAQGRFRADLYYRLNVLPLTLPPVRDRDLEDIVGLLSFLLDELGGRYRRKGVKLSDSALALMVRHEWPGNVREMRNALERALTLSIGCDEILPEHLPPDICAGEAQATLGAVGGSQMSLRELERRHVAHVLRSLGGNRSRAARVLGISRATLHNKIKKYDLAAA
ncbi:MAG: sigma-54 dependent transcriptional regulator [Gemmatimonadota bacterium]